MRFPRHTANSCASVRLHSGEAGGANENRTSGHTAAAACANASAHADTQTGRFGGEWSAPHAAMFCASRRHRYAHSAAQSSA